jgi:DNA (cytosine-5)-methyltransferase 1
MRQRPLAIDLFAGAGGLSLGLEQAGFDVVVAVEYDPVHSAVHAFNFPRTATVCTDLAQLSINDIALAAAKGLALHGRRANGPIEIDLVAGGPPCQGFSNIGKHMLGDSRNDLVFEFLRVVLGIRPKYFLMENVPGMAVSGHKSAVLTQLVDAFRKADYKVADPIPVLNAADFGVPQDRARLVLVGARNDVALPEYPIPTVKPRRLRKRIHEPSERLWVTLPDGPSVWDAIGDIPDAEGFAELLEADDVELTLPLYGGQIAAASPYAARLMGVIDDPDDLSHPRVRAPLRLTNAMRTNHEPTSVSRFEATAPGAQEPVSTLRRLNLDGLSPTIRAGTGYERGSFTSPRPIHPTRPRVLTVREAARIQSFPDWFRFHRTKWHGFRQVGNAVPPLLGRHLGRAIATVLGAQIVRPTEVWTLGEESLLALNMTSAARLFAADLNGIPGSWRRHRVA